MNIGFVGVGRMGANMARRLKDRGFHVTAVYDVNRAAATKLAERTRLRGVSGFVGSHGAVRCHYYGRER